MKTLQSDLRELCHVYCWETSSENIYIIFLHVLSYHLSFFSHINALKNFVNTLGTWRNYWHFADTIVEWIFPCLVQISVSFFRTQSTASQHWFRWYLCTKQGQAIILTNGHLDCWHMCINLFCCPFLDNQGATNLSTGPWQHCCGSVQNVVMFIHFFSMEVCIYQYNMRILTYWDQD